jgi:hypothetical protein
MEEEQIQTEIDELEERWEQAEHKHTSSMEQFELRLTPQTYVQAIMQLNPGASLRAPRAVSLEGIYYE